MDEESNSNSSTRVLRPFSGREKSEKRRDDFPMLTLEIKADQLAAAIHRLQSANDITNTGALECLALIGEIQTAANSCTEMFAALGAEVQQ